MVTALILKLIFLVFKMINVNRFDQSSALNSSINGLHHKFEICSGPSSHANPSRGFHFDAGFQRFPQFTPVFPRNSFRSGPLNGLLNKLQSLIQKLEKLFKGQSSQGCPSIVNKIECHNGSRDYNTSPVHSGSNPAVSEGGFLDSIKGLFKGMITELIGSVIGGKLGGFLKPLSKLGRRVFRF